MCLLINDYFSSLATTIKQVAALTPQIVGKYIMIW